MNELTRLKLQALVSALRDLQTMEAAWENVVETCSLFDRLTYIEGENGGFPDLYIRNQIADLGQRIYNERNALLENVEKPSKASPVATEVPSEEPDGTSQAPHEELSPQEVCIVTQEVFLAAVLEAACKYLGCTKPELAKEFGLEVQQQIDSMTPEEQSQLIEEVRDKYASFGIALDRQQVKESSEGVEE